MSSPWIVGFPLYDQVTLLDFAGATQVFGFSGDRFRPIWLGPEMRTYTTSEQIPVLPQYTFDYHPPIDMLFVPGGGPDGVIQGMVRNDYQDWLITTAKSKPCKWYGSVCVGAFILAAGGLLDSASAVTTYWSQLDTLRRFPTLKDKVTDGYPRWEIDREKQIFTGGGVSSSIDLALELVNIICGTEASKATQLSIQYAPQPRFESGDPSQKHAAPEIVESVLKDQKKNFIEPIREAVDKLVRE